MRDHESMTLNVAETIQHISIYGVEGVEPTLYRYIDLT